MPAQSEHFTEADATAFGEKFLAWANALSVTERCVLATVLEAMKNSSESPVQGYAIHLGGRPSGPSGPAQYNVPVASGNSGGATGGRERWRSGLQDCLDPGGAQPSPNSVPGVELRRGGLFQKGAR